MTCRVQLKAEEAALYLKIKIKTQAHGPGNSATLPQLKHQANCRSFDQVYDPLDSARVQGAPGGFGGVSSLGRRSAKLPAEPRHPTKISAHQRKKSILQHP